MKSIESCLCSLTTQFDEIRDYELILVDGESEDQTVSVAEDTIKQSGLNGFIINNPKQILASGWNLGILAAKGEFVVRPDAHSLLYPGYIYRGIEILKNHPEVVGAGGILITKGDGFWGKIIAAALSTRVGVGNSGFRVGGSSGYYDTAVYPVYRREALIDAGLFNESLKRNQDNDLNQRLRRAGWKIWMDSEMKADYYCRNSLKSLMSQMYGNGRYIAEVIR